MSAYRITTATPTGNLAETSAPDELKAIEEYNAHILWAHDMAEFVTGPLTVTIWNGGQVGLRRTIGGAK